MTNKKTKTALTVALSLALLCMGCRRDDKKSEQKAPEKQPTIQKVATSPAEKVQATDQFLRATTGRGIAD